MTREELIWLIERVKYNKTEFYNLCCMLKDDESVINILKEEGLWNANNQNI